MATAISPSMPAWLRPLARINPGWLALFAALILTGLGVSAIDTVRPPLAQTQWQRQLPIALLAMLLCVVPNPRWIGRLSFAGFALAVAALVFLLLPFVPRAIVPVVNGARSWVDLGVMRVQPSELTKIAFVLALAWYLRRRSSYRTLAGLLPPFVIMLVPVGLILKQPDLGTALLFGPALLAMLVTAGARLRHVVPLIAVVVLAVGLTVAVIWIDPPHERSIAGAEDTGRLPAWTHVLADHQERRIASMLFPEYYRNSDAFQQTTAVRLVGAGGWTGLGREQAELLIRYNHLPEPHNDMIYAVVVCRWGAVAGAGVAVMYGVLLVCMLLVAARSHDPFCRLACVGFGVMVFCQAMLNIAMTVGLMPITGIPLPFISYGGSSLLATYIMVGLTLNFAARPRPRLARPSFEFDDAEERYH